MKKFFYILVALLSTLSFWGCNNDHCDDSVYAPMRISLYKEFDTTNVSSPIMTISNEDKDIFISCMGENTIFPLMLDPASDSAKYVFYRLGSYYSQIEYDTVFNEEGAIAEVHEKLNGENVERVPLVNDFCLIDGNVYFFENGPSNLYQTIVDTLTIKYKSKQVFLSAECGYVSMFELKRVKFSLGTIGEAEIIKQDVTNKYNERHVNIYYKE